MLCLLFMFCGLWFCVRWLRVWFDLYSCSLLASAGLVAWRDCMLAVMYCVICVDLLCGYLLVLLLLACDRVLFTS